MNRFPETAIEWEFLNGCNERELVDEIKLRQRQLDDRNKREPLVQEVIRLSKARDAVSPYADKLKAHHASLLQVAARKLAEWTP